MKLWHLVCLVWLGVLLIWFVAFLVWLGVQLAPEAHADMCGPTAGLPGGSYPWIQSCNIWVPFVPGIKVPLPGPGGTAPFPVPGIGGAGGWLGPQQPGSIYNPTPYNPPLP